MSQVITLKVNMASKIQMLKQTFEETQNKINKEAEYLNKPNEIEIKTKKLEKEIYLDKMKIKFLKERCQSLQEEIALIDIDFLLKDKRLAVHQKYEDYSLLHKNLKIKLSNLKSKISNMVQASSNSQEKLKVHLEKLSKIQTLFNLCRKLESSEEQTLLFCQGDYSGLEGFLQSLDFDSVLKEQLESKYFNFYRKFSKVNLEVESLKLIKKNLLVENENLKFQFKKYISSLEINCLPNANGH